MLSRIDQCPRTVHGEFEHWDDPHARGPSLYFVVTDEAVATFAAPMGSNRCPTEDYRSVLDDSDGFHRTAKAVALSYDGVVVVR